MPAPRYEVYLGPSRASGKKYTAVVFQNGRKLRTVHFGAAGMSDYTIHKDLERMARYLSRHRAREDWELTGVTTPGFWARWILWSEPTHAAAVRATARRFGLRIHTGPPPGA